MTAQRPLRLAINGFGRIGRCFLRALHESGVAEHLQVVLINEPADLASMVYLTRFDSTHGRFPGTVEAAGDAMVVAGRTIAVRHEVLPEAVDWASFGIDLLVECSGQYASRDQLQRFLAAGCPRLLLSHPGHSAADVDATVVYGLNQHDLSGHERIISAASCTTNAIVPVLRVLHDAFGVEHAILTTLHSLMNDQPLIDGYHHTDLRRTRSAMQSMIPVATGLARGVERLLPELAGRIEAKAVRVPVANVSAIDLVALLERESDAAAINRVMSEAAENRLQGLLDVSTAPHVSIDFNHHSHSAIVDGEQTRTSGKRLVNLLIWFDNEWGFTNRLLDIAVDWQKRFN